MIDNLVRDIQVLGKADSLIGRIWVGVLARRFGLVSFAGLIAVFGLAMGNVAAFYALTANIGPVWAASIVAIVDFALGAIVLFIGLNSGPGREIELALEVRKMAVDAIQADARDIKLTVEALGQELRELKASLVGFAQHPFDLAAQKLLVPAALSIIKGIKSKKAQT